MYHGNAVNIVLNGLIAGSPKILAAEDKAAAQEEAAEWSLERWRGVWGERRLGVEELFAVM